VDRADIFISHIHEDLLAALGVNAFLRAKLPRDTGIFLSSSQLQIGDEWLERIRRALRDARIIIALFSPQSITRPWVNFEAGGAWFSDDKILMPLCIGGIKPETLPKPYSNIQGADLTDGAAAGYIVSSIWRQLSLDGSPPMIMLDDQDLKDLQSMIEGRPVPLRPPKGQ